MVRALAALSVLSLALSALAAPLAVPRDDPTTSLAFAFGPGHAPPTTRTSSTSTSTTSEAYVPPLEVDFLSRRTAKEEPAPLEVDFLSRRQSDAGDTDPVEPEWLSRRGRGYGGYGGHASVSTSCEDPLPTREPEFLS
ncbi:uncharacterized protein BXZ73DRAFT_77102 [Epithele typhae]|uniref:uncharacterized protein n=1 Tax=Epithele typhae TaxID=378194 RepID=UPI002007F5B1|nr:uncharacterized protein BXZ73DRAFT_77102 [Epithele typhae]KAH9933995.1 hypothetical protein BXZ73DRAFT_77102 [Epithele typhae]